MNKKILLIFVFFLLVIPSVKSQPPFEDIQVSTLDTPYLTIVYPKFQEYDIDCNLTLPFDILGDNQTKLNNSEVDCFYDIVDNCGDIITYGNLTYNSSLKYWFFNLPDTTPSGAYNYYVYCNYTLGTTEHGGFVSGGFTLQPGGTKLIQSETYLLPLTMGISILGIIFIVIGFLLLFKHERPNRNGEPRIEWLDILAGFLVYLGLLLFIILLHILAINTGGNTQAVLNTVFSVYLTIYSILVIFGFVGVIVQLLRWLVWSVQTPPWKKEQIRGR